jgi:hypothetical protein
VNLLDTDVLSHLQKNDSVGVMIAARMAASLDTDFQITTINAYEQILTEWTTLGNALGLSKILNHSTLQQASERLLPKGGPAGRDRASCVGTPPDP